MGREQLRAIFVEEANEIIEKLDSDIINFEENPQNRDLLNELFRGVHTLKGNSNAFGFTRLGGFVHHLEDVLDYYRNSKEDLPSSSVDTLLESVDIIKEVMNYEVNGTDGLPEKYDGCLKKIVDIIEERKGTAKQESNQTPQTMSTGGQLHDLADEFEPEELSTEEIIQAQIDICIERLKHEPRMHKNLFLVKLDFDKDIYFRGYDHALFFRLLAEMGLIVESWWNCDSIVKIEELKAEENSFAAVYILLFSDKDIVIVEELFEFLFENEWKIINLTSRLLEPMSTLAPAPQHEPKTNIAAKQESVVEHVESPKPQEPLMPNEVEHPIRRKEDVDAVQAQKSYIKIDTVKLDELFDSVGELVIAQNFIAQNELIKSLDDSNISKTIETLTKITKLIQDRVMSLRMVAIRDTFEKMKRVSRDTAKKTGKEIRLVIHGEETEIDKTMIDNLSDPLVHMIRNAIDHGLEDTAQDRLENGKAVEGTIALRAYHKNGNIIISISDDGRGINRGKVFAKALERGLVQPDDALSDSQVFALIMQPGFSTAATISDVSGRGVGLDVVKNSIEKLRGKIEIESEEGRGSTFSIILPLTLAIIDGMLVKSADDIYIIPTLSVVESFMPQREIVHMLKGKGEFVNLRGEHIPVIRLAQVLGLKDKGMPVWESTLVCVETEKGRFAVLVDELVGRQQVVIKTLGKSLSRISEISGGAILGNGEIALILNIEGLFNDVSTSV